MRRGSPVSITLRLTLLFAAMSSSVLLVLGVVIGQSVDRHFEQLDLEILMGKRHGVGDAVAEIRSQSALVEALGRLDAASAGHQNASIRVELADGTPLLATARLDFPERLGEALSHAPTSPPKPRVWSSAQGVPYRGIVVRIDTPGLATGGLIVLLATDISYHEHFLASFRLTLWSFVVLAAVLTGFLGWVAVRRGLLPLQTIRQKAESITATRLDARLAVDAFPGELAALAQTLNEMLSRLQVSFRRLSDFSSDLAHEFRTPVSNLLTQTQVTLSRTRTLEDYREVLVSNVEEFERLSRMIADMLFLAKADEGQWMPQREPLVLARLVDEVIEFYRLVAEEKEVSLVRQGDGVIAGDALMIRRAVSNLLSNAIRHTPGLGRVMVSIETLPERVRLSVENSGETIAREALPRLFDRFYRADPSRQRQSEGSGLGLAITRSIIEAHGGSVEVCSEDGLTVFVVNVPVPGGSGEACHP